MNYKEICFECKGMTRGDHNEERAGLMFAADIRKCDMCGEPKKSSFLYEVDKKDFEYYKEMKLVRKKGEKLKIQVTEAQKQGVPVSIGYTEKRKGYHEFVLIIDGVGVEIEDDIYDEFKKILPKGDERYETDGYIDPKKLISYTELDELSPIEWDRVMFDRYAAGTWVRSHYNLHLTEVKVEWTKDETGKKVYFVSDLLNNTLDFITKDTYDFLNSAINYEILK